MSTHSETVLVLSTSVSNIQDAERIAEVLVKERLAACVQILPAMTSYYFWEEKLEKSEELLLLIKTVSSKLTELEEKITKLHPYDCPEIVVTEVSHVAKSYRDWLFSQVNPENI